MILFAYLTIYCNIFQMGWNHQLGKVSFQVLSYLPGKRRICKICCRLRWPSWRKWVWSMNGALEASGKVGRGCVVGPLQMGENTWKSFPGFISPFTSWSQESKPPTNPNHQITIQWFTFTIGSGEGLQVRPRWYPFKTTENNPGLATKTPLQKLLEGTNASAQKVGDAKVFLVYFIRIASMYSVY